MTDRLTRDSTYTMHGFVLLLRCSNDTNAEPNLTAIVYRISNEAKKQKN